MRLTSVRFGEHALLFLLAFSVLWRGGKSIDTTFLLAIVVSSLVLLQTIRTYRNRDAEPISYNLEPALWLSGFAFILWSILSYLQSTTQNYGLDEILRDAGLFLILVVVCRMPSVTLGVRWHRFAATLTGAAALACLIGVAVYAWQPVDRFVGTFFDARFHTDYWPNAWAEFLLLVWPLTFVLLLRAASPMRRLGYLAILALILGALLLSYSRGALMAFGGQIFVIVVICSLRLRKSGWASFAALSLVFVFAAALAIVMFLGVNRFRAETFAVQSIGEKITFTASEGTSSIDERSAFWKQAFSLGKERPVFGWGPYSFRFIQPRLAEGVLQTSDHPHNVFLKLFMERGAPALLLFSTFLILLVYRGWKLLQQETDRSISMFRIAGFTAIAGVLAHNMIDYNLQFVGIALPLWILFALMISGSKEKGVRNNSRALLEAIIGVFLIVLVLVEGSFLLVSSLGRHAEAQKNEQAAAEWYELASAELYSRDLLLSKAHLYIQNNDIQKGSAALDAYAERNSEDPRLWEARGWLALKSNRGTTAKTSFERAYETGKWTNLGILHGFLLSHEKTREALTEEQYADVLFLVQSYASAILQNAHFVAISTNVEELLAIGKLLPGLCPSSPDVCDATLASIEVQVAAADRHAKEERATYSTRPNGFLW